MNNFSIGLILTILTGFAWGLVGIVFNYTIRKKIDYASLMFISSIISTVVVLLFFCDYSKIQISGQETLVYKQIIAIGASSLFALLGFWLMRKAMEGGHSGVIWAIVQSSMVISAIYAIFVYHEPVTIFKAVGLIFITASMAFFAFSKGTKPQSKEHRNNWWILSILASLFVGFSQLFTIFPSYWKGWNSSIDLRLPLRMTTILIIVLIYVLISKAKISKKAIFAGLAYAITSVTGQFLLFLSIDRMVQADCIALVYPIAVGTCVLTFSLYSIFIIKERTCKYTIAGLIIAVLGIVSLSIN
jgi:uncharacterized membrane protein